MNKKTISIIVGALVVAVIILGVIAAKRFMLTKIGFQKGMCYTTWNRNSYGTPESDKSLERLKAMGVNWVAILTTWYQERSSSVEIHPASMTPSDESVIHAIKKAHSLGMKVMVKPHLDIIDISDGSWRGDIAVARETDWEKWFESYTKFIVHYARIAQEHGAEMVCVGTELTSSSVTREAEWRGVIAAVRKVYKGPLTYAANWNAEYLDIRFWDALDYAGVDAYFPLSNKNVPSVEELKEGWVKWLNEMEAWQRRIDKPVLFPEVGYHSADGAARTPWTHEAPGKVNLKLQADCYKALLETFWGKEWWYGVCWWKWGTDVRMGGKHNRDFTPQNKLAEELIVEWYKKAVPGKMYK